MSLEQLDYKALTFWLHIVELIAIVMMAIYTWLSSRHRASAEAIEEVHDEMELIDRRLIAVEQDIKHLPTHDHISDVNEKLKVVGNAVATMEGQLKQINTNLQLIHKYLLNQGKKY